MIIAKYYHIKMKKMKKYFLIFTIALLTTSFASTRTSPNACLYEQSFLKPVKPITLTFIVIQHYPMGNGCDAYISGTVIFTWDPEKPKQKPVYQSSNLTLSFSGNCGVSRSISVSDFSWDEDKGEFNDITFNATGDTTVDSLLGSSTLRQQIVDELNAQL